VLPEITAERLPNLESLIDAEQQAGLAPKALRRLAALLPQDPEVAAAVAVRLKLSNKARKRIVCAAGAVSGASPQALAYRVGTDCAVDRLLLEGRAAEAAQIARWKPPRLPIGGGALIARGLAEGPIVARTLKRIENRWVDEGFPEGKEFERIVADALAAAV
jgi:poly(A) polymerase